MAENWARDCGLEEKSVTARALGALLGYLHRTQKKGVERLKSVHNYAEAQFMQLSMVTRANLELTQTLRGREKKGHPALGVGQDPDRHGQAAAAQLDRAAPGEQQGHQPAIGRGAGPV